MKNNIKNRPHIKKKISTRKSQIQSPEKQDPIRTPDPHPPKAPAISRHSTDRKKQPNNNNRPPHLKQNHLPKTSFPSFRPEKRPSPTALYHRRHPKRGGPPPLTHWEFSGGREAGGRSGRRPLPPWRHQPPRHWPSWGARRYQIWDSALAIDKGGRERAPAQCRGGRLARNTFVSTLPLPWTYTRNARVIPSGRLELCKHDGAVFDPPGRAARTRTGRAGAPSTPSLNFAAANSSHGHGRARATSIRPPVIGRASAATARPSHAPRARVRLLVQARGRPGPSRASGVQGRSRHHSAHPCHHRRRRSELFRRLPPHRRSSAYLRYIEGSVVVCWRSAMLWYFRCVTLSESYRLIVSEMTFGCTHAYDICKQFDGFICVPLNYLSMCFGGSSMNLHIRV